MTMNDRFAQRLPELMDELAPPRIPDYFDDMLRAAERTRQRPAWTSLERLLPMDIAARPAPFGLPSWRPVLTMLVIVALLVAAGAFVIAGSQRKLPPLFGPAANGAVIYSNETGDIFSLDPATGKAVTIIGGASNDQYPFLSPDGQQIMFVRVSEGRLYTANIDGSEVRALATVKEADTSEWSLDSKRIVYVAVDGGTPFIRDVATGATRAVPVSAPVRHARWLTDGQLLLLADTETGRTHWTINEDGSNQRELVMPDACCGASALPGTSLVAWTSWGVLPGTQGRIHVVDVASGKDTELASTDKPNLHFLDPQFSPDGKWLLVSQVVAGLEGNQIGLLAADGSEGFTPIGRKLPKNSDDVRAAFSADGTKLLVTYDDGSTWLFDVPGGEGTEVAWPGIVNASWQRVALPD
jgi:Tol biopolymer transport system component